MKYFIKFCLSLCCLSCLTAQEIEAAKPATYLADFCKALDTPWPKNHCMTIVCHGHSVPAGYAKTPIVDSFAAYPHQLHKALKEQHPYAVMNVIVTAIGGENSEQGAARFERDVMSLRPDVLLIDYGLNDRRLPLATSRAAWQSMIDKAKAAGCKIILLTPTADSGAKILDPQDPLSLQAAQIRELATANHIALADSYVAFQEWLKSGKNLNDVLAQPNHPNAAGHQLVLQKLLPWFPAK